MSRSFAKTALACVALSLPLAAAAAPDASSYVQSGLVGHYDGIDNAGTGTHDPGATAWKDLAGALGDGALGAGAAWADGTCWTNAANGQPVTLGAAFSTNVATKTFTVELVLKPDAVNVRRTLLGNYSSVQNFNIECYSDARIRCYYNNNPDWYPGAKLAAGATSTVTLVTTPSSQTLYTNGVSAATRTGTLGAALAAGPNTIVGGDLTRADYAFRGACYALRVYNRALSAGETAVNANLDRIRFEGANPGALAWPDGYNAENGTVYFKVEATAAGGSTVTLNGESSDTAVSFWTELGSSTNVTVAAALPAGTVLHGWNGAPPDAVVAGNSISFTARTAVALSPIIHTCLVKYWRGGTSTSAAEASNWSDAEALGAAVSAAPPMTGDAIILDGKAAEGDGAPPSQRAMVWDLDEVEPASWTQNGYTNAVTFKTGTPGVTSANTACAVYGSAAADGTKEFRVSGGVDLQTGAWTVSAHPSSGVFPTMTPASAKATALGAYRLIAKSGGDFWIGTGARIHADGKGLPAHTGPGVASYTTAAHGGMGGFGSAAQPPCYGSVYRPVCLGSGSGTGYYSGGAVRIESQGELTVNGTVSASAVTNAETRASSGGSVLLVGDSISGSGTVIARGGASNWAPAAGGGGRVALIQTGAARDFSRWTGTATAPGGPYSSGSGAPGTVYYETADKLYRGDLVVQGRGSAYWEYSTNPSGWTRSRCNNDNNRWRTTILTGVLGETNLVFDTVTIRDYASLGVGTNVTLRFNTLTCVGNQANMLTLYGGTLVLKEPMHLTNMNLRVFRTGSRIEFEDDVVDRTLTIGANCEFAVDYPCTLAGNLVVTNGGSVRHTMQRTTGTTYHVELQIDGDLHVAPNSRVDANGCGWDDVNAPGYPSIASRAGSHGGLAQDIGTAVCYGSIRRPVLSGSGNRSASINVGGGVIRLNVDGTSTIDGAVSANGLDAYWHAAAGGSIWISTGRLRGIGNMTANGGYSTSLTYGAGGGGRVAVWLTAPGEDFGGFPVTNVTAYGAKLKGTTKNERVGAGTIYLKTGDQAEDEGTLIVKNADAFPTNAYGNTRVSSFVADTAVGSVIVTNNARLVVEAGNTLTVKGDFRSNKGTFQAELSGDAEVANAVVRFADSNVVARVTGTNVFADFVCDDPGKTMLFGTAADATLTTVAGSFSVAGGADDKIKLKSLLDGTYWLLAVTGAAAVNDVYVSDSDARGGNVVSASGSSGARCENWTFVAAIVPGATNEWLGADPADPESWAQIGNWSQGRAPVDTDCVVIPSGRGHYPRLASNFAFNSLIVESGASLDLAGYSIAVTNLLAAAGTITATGAETLTFTGPAATFSGAAFAGSPFALALGGDGAQSIDPAGREFSTVTVAKGGGSTVWTAGFTADTFACAAASPLAMTFAAGSLAAVRELRLNGAGTGSSVNLDLASATPGSAWRLTVFSYPFVSGVRVSDCNASGGKTIYADTPSEDGLRNTNWVFNRAQATWTGTGGNNDFANAANWSPASVPDASTMVVVDSNARISLTPGETFPVHALYVTGTNNIVSGTNALLVIGESCTLDGAALQLDAPTVVTNAAVLRNGASLTHAANGAADVYEVNLTVLGDLTVDAASRITARGKGYSLVNGYPGARNGDQAAHGGRPRNSTDSCACYGSALRPRTSGSSTYSYGRGGGRIYLRVGGTATVDGEVQADGSYGDWLSAAGGSVFMTAGRLVGSGRISADAGTPTINTDGGGGRVAVYLTETSDFAAFAGIISAYGSRTTQPGSVPKSSAGTVYLQGADGTGCMVIDNDGGIKDNTSRKFIADFPVPEARGGDPVKAYRDVVFVVRDSGGINVLSNMKIAELELGACNTVNTSLYVNASATLRILSTAHKNGAGWTGGYDLADGLGEIVWGPVGMLLYLR